MITLGDEGHANLVSIQPRWQGYRATLLWAQKSYQFQTSMLGTFNLWNMAAVFIAISMLGFRNEDVLKYISQCDAPQGRMEVIKAPGGRHIVIDYAHTPDALENALKTLQELNPIRIVVVFGCGGDRDKTKRPTMGKVASNMSDFVILTNDNPRSEDEQSIVNDIKEGIEGSHYIVVFERDKAIRAGLQILGVQEALLIAGKGHENTQIIHDKILSFSDKDEVLSAIKELDFTANAV